MVNFRMTEGELDLLDRLSKAAGTTRTDYIKNCLRRAMGATPAKPKPSCPNGDPLTCSVAAWVKLPSGAKICQNCGIK